MPYYDVIADYRVNPRARHLEELTRSDVCEILKIKPPARRWIVEDEFGPHWFENDVFGWCSKDGQTIFIRHDCSPFQIANVLVHEARRRLANQKSQAVSDSRQDVQSNSESRTGRT